MDIATPLSWCIKHVRDIENGSNDHEGKVQDPDDTE